MDYFSVIVLIIVVFIFISDRKIKSIEIIKKENNTPNIDSELNDIKANLKIIKTETKEIDHDIILKLVTESNDEYVLIYNKFINLDTNNIDTLIANYITSDKRPCGVNLLYVYKDKKWSLKRLYVDIINYLNIFNKQDISTYGIIMCKKSDCINDKKKFENSLISYTATDFTSIDIASEQVKTNSLKKMYTSKLTKADITIIIKILLLIISGSLITTNLIYSVLNVSESINGLIISAVIYYCYSYIIRYIYKPIGKQRIIASYIFPIYFIAYILVGSYTILTKVIKKVHAS